VPTRQPAHLGAVLLTALRTSPARLQAGQQCRDRLDTALLCLDKIPAVCVKVFLVGLANLSLLLTLHLAH